MYSNVSILTSWIYNCIVVMKNNVLVCRNHTLKYMGLTGHHGSNVITKAQGKIFVIPYLQPFQNLRLFLKMCENSMSNYMCYLLNATSCIPCQCTNLITCFLGPQNKAIPLLTNNKKIMSWFSRKKFGIPFVVVY